MREGDSNLELPQGFLLPDEEPERGLGRVMRSETGWSPEGSGQLVSEGYAYDSRQTDHAWVEKRGYVVDADQEPAPDVLEPGGEFEELSWWPLNGSTMTRLSAGQAQVAQAALEHARASGKIDDDTFERLVSRAG